MSEKLTPEEVTRAMLYSLKGDSKMTPEERNFVATVIVRQANEETEAIIRFLERLS